jgi:hypothetical protein
VSAIFLLVVLAGLDAFITTIFINQQVSSTLSLMCGKAYQDPHLGTKWGHYTALKTVPPYLPSTDIGLISNMKVTSPIITPVINVTKAGTGAIYSITATACNTPYNDLYNDLYNAPYNDPYNDPYNGPSNNNIIRVCVKP